MIGQADAGSPIRTEVTLREPGGAFSGAGYGYRQSFAYGNGVQDAVFNSDGTITHIEHPRELEVVTAELWGSRYESTVATFSASFDIQSVVSRGPNEFFVLGHDDEDSLIVERWTMIWPVGAPVARLGRISGSLIGLPQADELVVETSIIGGGLHVDPKLRRPPSMQRDRIYASNQFGAARSMSPDLQGRYVVLLVDGGPAIIRLRIQGIPIVEVLTDASHQSVLSNHSSIVAFADQDQGRGIYSGSAGADHDQLALFLWDADNDGVFESDDVLSDHWAWLSDDSPIDWCYDLTALGYDF